jgi:acyl-CoA dehydrogenase
MTEPGTGSDLAGIKTRGEDKGDHWLLNGSKTYISNGLISNLCVVAARTNPDSPHAVGLFVVEEGMPGFKRGRKLKKLGLHSQDTAELFFQDVKVPRANVLGEPTQGFRNLMLNLAEERLTSAVGNVTRAERAFEVTLAYITERKAFGRPIGTFQNSRFKMADMRARIDACWALVDHCVMEHVERKLTGETAAAAKLYVSEVEGWVVDECLQLHGGAGYMDEYEICRLYADARISRIYAGTSEIMKEIIGRGLGLDERKRN